MRQQLLSLLLLTPMFVAEPVLSNGDGPQVQDNATDMADEAKGEGARSGTANKSSGRVIEYSGDSRGGVIEATPNIREAEDSSAEASDKKSAANAKSKQKKIEQQNSVKLITGGDPTEGSAKVGRLPVLD